MKRSEVLELSAIRIITEIWLAEEKFKYKELTKLQINPPFVLNRKKNQ